MVIWGVSWASAKMITNYTNLEVILFWRLLVTFISLIPVLWITKDSFRIPKKGIPYAIGGAFVMLIYNALFFYWLTNWTLRSRRGLRDYIKSNYQFLFGCPVI